MPPLHRQPLKFLYLVYVATQIIFVKLPYWTLISIFPSQRPRPRWSFSKSIRVNMLRSIIDKTTALVSSGERDLKLAVSDSEWHNSKFVWVEGVGEGSIQGTVREYARIADVKSTPVPGYWQFKDERPATGILQAKDGEKVVYHLHGGAFITGSAHPSEPGAQIPRGMMENSNTISRSFALEYRLSASAPFPAKNPFPCALLDAVAGYQYLIELGFRPKNIILSGDSAGGNLALALSRYLTKYDIPNLPPPGKLVLLSPWGDLSSASITPMSSRITNQASDIFLPNGRLGLYGAMSYLGSALGSDELKSNEYLSPASPCLTQTRGMFKSFPKTYVLAGGAEGLLDDSKVLAERIEADNSSDGWVKLDVAEDEIHNFIFFPWCEPERSEALVRIGKWLDQD